MIPTLSWAPLKNSGLRSMGMRCVALLIIFGNVAFTAAGPLPVCGSDDEIKSHKYSRFEANRKSRVARCYGLFTGGGRERACTATKAIHWRQLRLGCTRRQTGYDSHCSFARTSGGRVGGPAGD